MQVNPVAASVGRAHRFRCPRGEECIAMRKAQHDPFDALDVALVVPDHGNGTIGLRREVVTPGVNPFAFPGCRSYAGFFLYIGEDVQPASMFDITVFISQHRATTSETKNRCSLTRVAARTGRAERPNSYNLKIAMKQLLRLPTFPALLTCGLLLLTLCSCSPGGDLALIGKWKAKDSDDIIEIRKDGTWVESMDKDAQITSSKWQWEDTNHLRLTLKSKLVGKASGVMKVTIKGDTLVLKDEDGATEYTRVK